MSMLEVVQRQCRRSNIPVPTTVVGSTDDQVLQVMALLEEEGNDLSSRGDWQALINEATHTTLATESQGTIESIASNGFNYVKNNTMWDRTETLPVYVIDSVDWQAEKGFAITSPHYQARIRGGELLSIPTPAAGNTWAFEYISKNWILGVDGTTYSQYFNLDTDTLLLPEEILLKGLRWRWKKEKGFEYAEDFDSYEIIVKDTLSRQGIHRNIHLDDGRTTRSPHIIVNDTFPL